MIDPPTRRSPGELPAWLVANRWHQFLLVALAESATPSQTASPCAQDSSCLVLQTDRGAPQLATAALVMAGPTLPGQLRSRGQPGDWFEQENALAGNALREGAPSANFNDRVLRLDAND